MPAPKAISPHEKECIRQYLQETYGIPVADAYDCQALSDAILKQSATSISCSTLRRLFNLVPSTSMQSRFILNALAFAVGFANWDVFKKHVAGFDANMINQNIQIYYRQLPDNSQVVLETIKNLPISTWLGGYQLQSIVSIAIEKNDFELLDAVVAIPFEIDNLKVYEHLVIAFQSFYFQSVKGNIAIISFVQRNIAKSKVLQYCLLQAYVDESQLNGFLGLWFDAIQEQTLPDLLLFKNLLLCQKAFVVEKDISKAKKIAAEVSVQVAISRFEIHPILKARIGVWELILNQNPKKLSKYFNELQNPFEIADFAVISSRLLWMYHSVSESIPFLDQINTDKFPVVKNYFQKGRYNVLLLTIAINHYLQEDTANAKKNFKLVDSNTFAYDIVNIDFYIAWMERLKLLK